MPNLNYPNPKSNPNPNPKHSRNLCGTTAYNVFRKLIVTFRRVPWIILF